MNFIDMGCWEQKVKKVMKLGWQQVEVRSSLIKVFFHRPSLFLCSHESKGTKDNIFYSSPSFLATSNLQVATILQSFSPDLNF